MKAFICKQQQMFIQHHIVIMNVVGGQVIRENSLSFHIVPLGRRIQTT